MHHVEDALPAGIALELGQKRPIVSEFTICGLFQIGRRRLGEREIDHQRPGHNLLPRDKAPEAGIVTVIAIVAQDKILTRWDHELAVASKALHLFPPSHVHVRICVIIGGKFIAEGSTGGGIKSGVGLVEECAVHGDAAIVDAQSISGKTHYPLDNVWMLRVVEDNDIATRDIAIGHEPPGQVAGRSIHLLVDKQKVELLVQALSATI